MTACPKVTIFTFLGLLSGMTLSVWIAFGGDVYAAYLNDLILRCF